MSELYEAMGKRLTVKGWARLAERLSKEWDELVADVRMLTIEKMRAYNVDPATRSCNTCEFWRKTTGELGECRRRAPSFGGDWCATTGHEWCGEYSPTECGEEDEDGL